MLSKDLNIFKERISDKVKVIVERNAQLKGNGNLHEYQCNCCMLKGIDFVMENFRKIKI